MKHLKILVLFFVLLSGSACFAADAAPAAVALAPPPGFEWIVPVLAFIQGLPTVGPIISSILKYMGALATLMTIVSGSFRQLAKLVSTVLEKSGMDGAADKVDAFVSKVYPFLAFFGMQNVQKGPGAPAAIQATAVQSPPSAEPAVNVSAPKSDGPKV
jgi:hypothetical protein